MTHGAIKLRQDLHAGLDASSQSITAVVIDNNGIVEETSFSYHDLQPEGYELGLGYWSRKGGIHTLSEPEIFGSPVVWAKGLDQVIRDLDEKGLTQRIAAISGSGQQHGSVYLGQGIESFVSGLDPDGAALHQQLLDRNVFSRIQDINGTLRAVSPIWMDASTTEEMRHITDAVGGLRGLIEITGSGAFERFTGPQIRKFFETNEYPDTPTNEIHLVSSFHAGLLSGVSAIDPGDASGMMLMDIATRKWNQQLLDATAPNLRALLPTITNPTLAMNGTSDYFKLRHSLDAITFPWSGDNPCSVVGCGAVDQDTVVISLGTSDTLFGFLGEGLNPDYSGESCIFGVPTSYKDNMSLICWKNGSITRELLKDRYGVDWDGFSDYLLNTEPDEDKIGVYWHLPEITPHAPGDNIIRSDNLTEADPYNMKACVEGTIMSMLTRMYRLGITPKRILVTGGGSANEGLLQTIADISGVEEVRTLNTSNSAALGAALMAKHGHMKYQGLSPNWTDLVSPYVQLVGRFTPNMARHAVYQRMLPKYQEFEAKAAERLSR